MSDRHLHLFIRRGHLVCMESLPLEVCRVNPALSASALVNLAV